MADSARTVGRISSLAAKKQFDEAVAAAKSFLSNLVPGPGSSPAEALQLLLQNILGDAVGATATADRIVLQLKIQFGSLSAQIRSGLRQLRYKSPEDLGLYLEAKHIAEENLGVVLSVAILAAFNLPLNMQ